MVYDFPNELSEDSIGNIERKIYFLSEEIKTYSIKKDDKRRYIKIDIDIEDKNIEEQIATRLDEIVKDELENVGIKHNRVWEDDYINDWENRDILEYLLDKGVVKIHGEGQISIKQPLIDLLNLFDEIFATISKKLFNAEEYVFPTLLKTSVLKKVGYFDSFPNLLMFTLRLRNEVENYYQFKEEYKELDSIEKVTEALMKYLCVTDYSLPPTMCYYVYDMFSESELSNCAVTAKGKSFRYENKYCEPFKRLSDFTIRESVFLGDREYVKECISKYRSLAIRVMECLKIKGICEAANDPFYLVENYHKKIKAQNILGAKYELRANVNERETIAIGSFNLHGQFLAKRFKLYRDKNNESYINTGCVGIGLERFLYSFLVQYGIDREKWPQHIISMLNDKNMVKTFVENLEK